MNISRSQNRDKKILSELKTVIEDLGVDHLPTFGGKYEGGIHLQQVADEIAPCIYDLMKVNWKFKNFLEIGSAAGGNTYLFNHFFNFDNITIIDNNQHKKYALRQEVLKDVPHCEFIGDSHSKLATTFLEYLRWNYDIIFVDGDHSYAGVKKDVGMCKQFLNYNSFLILHDTFSCKGVKQFSDELKEEAEVFTEYISSGVRRLGITVFQMKTIPKWREGK